MAYSGSRNEARFFVFSSFLWGYDNCKFQIDKVWLLYNFDTVGTLSCTFLIVFMAVATVVFTGE